MYKLYPYFTNDGSVGLYSPEADDIYHSTYGALSEAYEKFILPADFKKFFQKNNEIKILDICFGIGYNTKCFLNYYFDLFEKSLNDNLSSIESVDTDNIFKKISVTCIDTDENLIHLSPFVKTYQKILTNNKINFENEKIKKILNNSTKPKYMIHKFVKILFLLKLVETCPNIFNNRCLKNLIKSKKYSKFFDKDIIRLFKFLEIKRCKSSNLSCLSYFLHNIYYNHISNSYKKALKYLKIVNLNFNVKCDDARKVILHDDCSYNYIFLDAFSPVKCPCLWTVDFFKLLHSHLDDNGMILTYSNSAAVRNAMINAGLWVGKIYDNDKDKYIGTIAAKNLALIKNGLSEYDLGLIKTKAGIFYRDENLTLDNESIIAQHEIEVAASNNVSSSKFIRKFRGAK